MDPIIEFFRHTPLFAVFLTLGLGFWLGKMKIGAFSLGAVAATLIVGILIGQMQIQIPDMLKTVFFLLFLFAIGYSVGPQFVRSFKGAGVKQMLFAVVSALVCAGTVLLAAGVIGYDTGIAAGLFAGSQTASASLGLIGDTVRGMSIDEDQRAYLLKIIPACYAVTYLFGTVGSAWYLTAVAPKLMGGLPKVLEETASIEQTLSDGSAHLEPGQIRASREVLFRAYRLDGSMLPLPATVSQLEAACAAKGWYVYVERAVIGSRIVDPQMDTLLIKGDRVVLGGRAEDVIAAQKELGPEVADLELLDFGAERTPVTVSAKGADGLTLGMLRERRCMDRVMVASVKRNGMRLPDFKSIVLQSGDVVTIVGWPRDVAMAAKTIGYADRQTDSTDMVFLGLGLALGCLIGGLSLKLNGLSMSLGLSVGALLSGLMLGWCRSRRPTFGHIPSSVIWILNNLGVNMFIAVIGITAGASFTHGIEKAGWWIFIVGAVCTLVALTLNVLIARYLFRFSRPETLGCVAGARCAVAAMGAIQDTLRSDVPNLGYTVTYAVANVALVFSSLLVLFLI